MKNSTFLRNLWLWVLLLVAGSVSAQVTTVTLAMGTLQNDGSYVFTLGEGEYTTYSSEAVSDFKGKILVFEGKGAGKTTWKYGKNASVNGESGSDYSFDGAASVTFKDLTLQDNFNSTSYYRGFVRPKSMHFENCEFKNMMGYFGDSNSDGVWFKNCTFNVASNAEYCVKTYGGSDFYFDGCTFNAANKGFIQLYIQDNSKTHNAYINNCTFNKVEGNTATLKTAVYWYNYNGSSEGADWNVYFTGNNINNAGISANATSGTWMYEWKYTNTASVYNNGVCVMNEGDAQTISETNIPNVATTTNQDITAVNKETTIDDIADVSSTKNYLYIEVESEECAEGAAYATTMAFNVKPIAATITGGKLSTEVIPNNKITEDITFRLPVDADATQTLAEVFHNGESIGTKNVQTSPEGKYIEISTKEFSNFSYTLLDGAPATPVAKIGDVEYTSLEDAIKAALTANNGTPVELLSDITYADGAAWTPIVFNGGTVVIDGKGFTVTGLPGMLFNKQGSGSHHLRMSNITFDGANVPAGINYGNYNCAAVICPYADSMNELYFENVTIKNSTVTGTNYAGAFVGYAAGYDVQNDGPVFQEVTFKNCTVENCTITGGGSTGALIGHAAGNAWGKVTVEGTTVKDNTITCTGSSTNKAGSLFGTVGAAGLGTGPDGADAGLFVSATVSGNTVKSGSATITTICGRQGSTGGTLVLTEGGSYDAQPYNEGDAWASCAEGYAVEENDGKWSVVESAPVVAKIGETTYSTLSEAVAAAHDGQTIQLIDDATIDAVQTIADGRKITIDLNGNNITGSSYFQVTRGALTLTGEGTYETSAVYALKAVGAATDQGADYSVINVGEDVTVKATHETYGYVGMISIAGNKASYGAKINFNGQGEGRLGLYVNGQVQAKTGNVPEITVGENAIVKSAEYAVYAAGYANYNINGTIQGVGGIEAKAGVLTIGENAKVKATATTQSHETNNNGTSTSGYAIVSVYNDGYAGTVLNISNGTVIGKIISINDKTGADYPAGISISGGSFSEVVPADYCAIGYVPVTTADVQGMYTVEECDVKLNIYVAGAVTADPTTPGTSTFADFFEVQKTNSNAIAIVPYSDIAWAIAEKSKNIVLYTTTMGVRTYVCPNLVLVDYEEGVTENINFYSPVDFTALKVSYNRKGDEGTPLSVGYNSVCLPFAINSSNVNGTIYAFANYSLDASEVHFTPMTSVEAGTPCLVTTNEAEWNINLTNAYIKANPVTSYGLRGTYADTKIGTGYYKLNDTGDKYTRTTSESECYAFRTYLMIDETLGIGTKSNAFKVVIDDEDDLTAVDGNVINNSGDVEYRDLNGNKVTNPIKGQIYIVGGKKIRY